MNTRLFDVVLLALTISGLMAATSPPARAEVQYPWCAKYRRDVGGTNCGFVTYQQCLATISGVGGICYRRRTNARGADNSADQAAARSGSVCGPCIAGSG